MNSHVKALRAITAVFFQKVFRPTAWIVGGLLLLAWGLLIYLGGWVHPLWFVVTIILLPVTILAVAVSLGLWVLSKKLLPRKLSHEERRVVHQFTDKLLRLAEVRATPFPILAFLIAKDVVRKRKSEYIESAVQDATSLASDFNAISKLF
jgi:hypothetical protein